MNSLVKILFFSWLALLMSALPCFAAIGGPSENVIWSGATGGDFSGSLNWTWPAANPGYPPSAWDYAWVANGTTPLLTSVYPATSEIYGIGELWVGAIDSTVGVNGSAGLTIGDGGNLAVWAGHMGRNSGASGHASGTLNQLSGSSFTAVYLSVGSDTGNASGYWSLAGGEAHVIVSWDNGLNVGTATGGSGVIDQTGGTLITDTGANFGAGTDGLGVYNISGGTANFSDWSLNAGFWGTGAGVINIHGTAQVSAPILYLGVYDSAIGICNLGTVGATDTSVLAVNEIGRLGAASTGVFNFHGGTLQAKVDNANFMSSSNTLTAAIVYAEGATIDTNGNDITIATPLSAPEGSGVSSIPVAGGSGYTGAPAVRINGDGFGATAVAQVVDGVVTAVTITNPGTGYTSIASVEFLGGGAATPATVDPLQVGLAANVSGGLNKVGLGTLTLSAVNTYAGNTLVEEGKLAMTAAGSLANSPLVEVADGAALQCNGAVALGDVHLLDGSSAVWALSSLTDDTAEAGIGFDSLAVGGDVVLGSLSTLLLDFGALAEADRPDAATVNSFWTSAHDWKIISTESISGDFAGVTNATFAGVGSFSTTVTSDGMNLHFAPVPEPSAIVLLVLGALGLLACAKRRS